MARTQLKPVLNCKPSLRHVHDLRYGMIETPSETTVYPAKCDILAKMPPVFDQSTIGSCSMNSLVACSDHLEMLELSLKLPASEAPQIYGKYYTPGSRLFGYWTERLLEGTTGSDAGATTLRDGCLALQKFGICRETTWPYHVNQVLAKPTDKAFTEALPHKVSAFYALSGLQEMKKCLVHGYPFVLGFTVYESFMDDSWWANGIMPHPQSWEQIEGGHAVTVVGYDDSKQAALVRNSWGKVFGIQSLTHLNEMGHFWMPYSILLNANMVGDFYTLRRVPSAI